MYVFLIEVETTYMEFSVKIIYSCSHLYVLEITDVYSSEITLLIFGFDRYFKLKIKTSLCKAHLPVAKYTRD